jgi:hypothetical protein
MIAACNARLSSKLRHHLQPWIVSSSAAVARLALYDTQSAPACTVQIQCQCNDTTRRSTRPGGISRSAFHVACSALHLRASEVPSPKCGFGARRTAVSSKQAVRRIDRRTPKRLTCLQTPTASERIVLPFHAFAANVMSCGLIPQAQVACN